MPGGGWWFGGGSASGGWSAGRGFSPVPSFHLVTCVGQNLAQTCNIRTNAVEINQNSWKEGQNTFWLARWGGGALARDRRQWLCGIRERTRVSLLTGLCCGNLITSVLATFKPQTSCVVFSFKFYAPNNASRKISISWRNWTNKRLAIKQTSSILQILSARTCVGDVRNISKAFLCPLMCLSCWQFWNKTPFEAGDCFLGRIPQPAYPDKNAFLNKNNLSRTAVLCVCVCVSNGTLSYRTCALSEKKKNIVRRVQEWQQIKHIWFWRGFYISSSLWRQKVYIRVRHSSTKTPFPFWNQYSSVSSGTMVLTMFFSSMSPMALIHKAKSTERAPGRERERKKTWFKKAACFPKLPHRIWVETWSWSTVFYGFGRESMKGEEDCFLRSHGYAFIAADPLQDSREHISKG